MNTDDVKRVLEFQGVNAAPVHSEAAARILSGLLKDTAQGLASLPLEAEPSGFQAAQRRSAP